jgi:hypothetical protein
MWVYSQCYVYDARLLQRWTQPNKRRDNSQQSNTQADITWLPSISSTLAVVAPIRVKML